MYFISVFINVCRVENVHPVVYRCHHGVFHSDHRAVMAEFSVDI
jgi:hypothetical protein